jgi:hypothetical protein
MSMCGDPVYSQEVTGESLIDSGNPGGGFLKSSTSIPDVGKYINADKDLRGTSKDFSHLDISEKGNDVGIFAISPKEAAPKKLITKYFVNSPKVTPKATAPAPLPSPKPATSPIITTTKAIKPIINKTEVVEIDPSNLPASKPLLESELLHELMLEESMNEI